MEAENTQSAIEKRDDQEEQLELNVHIQEQLDKCPSSHEETYFSDLLITKNPRKDTATASRGKNTLII